MKAASVLLLVRRYLGSRGQGGKSAARRIRGGIMGIALSLIPLVLVYQVASGMIQGISARYLETGSYHLQAWANAWAQDASELGSPQGLETWLGALPGVVWAGREIQGMVLGAGPGGSTGVALRGIKPELVEEPGFAAYMATDSGSFDLSGPRNVVLGREVARVLGVGAGDQIRILSFRRSGGTLFPRVSRLEVRGVVSCGYQELDRLWAFCTLETAGEILPEDNRQDFVGLKLADPYVLDNPVRLSQDPLSKEAWTRMRDELGLSWRLYSWFQLHHGSFMNFVTTRNLLMFIMILIVLVASFNVSSTMVMLVLEKQQELAILKGMGASPGGIRGIFLLAGGICGGLGALAGLAIGSVLSLFVNELILAMEQIWNFLARLSQAVFQPQLAYQYLEVFNPAHYLDRIPVGFDPGFTALIFILTLGLSVLASWIPARKAAGLRPLEIMRKV